MEHVTVSDSWSYSPGASWAYSPGDELNEDEQRRLEELLEKEEEERAVAQAALQADLSARGLRYVQIPGDGDCQFAAIARALAEESPEQFGTITAAQVRQTVCDWLAQNMHRVGGESALHIIWAEGFETWEDWVQNMQLRPAVFVITIIAKSSQEKKR